MGQTLSHGVYLPNEGERNCYAGLASNWQILNTAVGVIAEKAPLVHTHTVSQITDFPAYGNAAGTICEGNDSRLSDARTPVAHTHTKGDVTDLLNSNFIPSANNSYDLGSSSNQWNNLYAKNYYYKGTAWGLDKYNQWTGVNDFNDLIGLNGAELWFKNSNIDDITANPSADTGKSIVQIWNKGTTQYCGGIIDGLDTSGTHVFEIVNFGYPLNSTNAYQHRFRFASKRDGTASFYPTYPNVDLGTSTNKWKTLNGINPGALSLPDTTREEPIDRTNWVYTYTAANVYYPPEDGWLAVACSGSDYMQIDGDAGWGITLSKGYDGFCTGIIPVKKNKRVQIRIKETSSGSVVIRKASFYPGTGDPSFTVTPLNNS